MWELGSPRWKRYRFLPCWVETNGTPFDMNATKLCMFYLSVVKKEYYSVCKFILFKAKLSGTRPARTAKWDISFPSSAPTRALKDGCRVLLATKGNLVNMPWWQAPILSEIRPSSGCSSLWPLNWSGFSFPSRLGKPGLKEGVINWFGTWRRGRGEREEKHASCIKEKR